MSDPAKLMTEAKAVLERAKAWLSQQPDSFTTADTLIEDMADLLAAMLAQEEARFGKDAA